MSICIMFRKCEHCGYKYTYDPSVGNFGVFCPKCKRGQTDLIGKDGWKNAQVGNMQIILSG